MYEAWKVELRKLAHVQGEKQGVYESDDLLSTTRSGEGGSYFPKEDLVAVFYPDTSKMILVNGQPWFEGRRAVYPLTTKRKIKVESFFVILKASDAEFIADGRKQFKSMDISIEFTNK